jgi:hypothetical protein
MISALAVAAGVTGGAGLAALALRDSRRMRASRAGLLDDCTSFFDEANLRHGGDGFPCLGGVIDGTTVTAELVPDTMTIRRLPQLWLVVTMRTELPVAGGLAALARPAGTEFYSLTEHFHHRLATPAELPEEVLIRGLDNRADELLAAVAPSLTALFCMPRTKEVAVTARGLRVVFQAGEGRRGEHLLMRQCVFDNAAVAPSTFRLLLDGLAAIRQAIAERAAAAVVDIGLPPTCRQ